MVTIELKNLCIGYKNDKTCINIVADNINAKIHSGELTCLLGANGVGKSTLLRTLSGFQPKISGDIFIKDIEINKITDKQLAKTIGVVLTEKPDLSNITAKELVGMGRSPYTDFWGSISEEDNKIIEDAMNTVGIKHLEDRMIQTLSDGERQKVMIAKALSQQTPIIFLDEPTAFLDFPSKIEIMQLLRKLCRDAGKTIFLSTHDLEIALQIADTVWLMNRKKEVSIGTPKQLSENGELSRYVERKGILFDKDTMKIKILKD
ncbi:MAG: ABC transporter ATP-binding protein [Prevotella sp.]|nr:ABC transporter ATP-binding protein [Prevotella sp.]